jgi:hypothetical protein
VWVRNKNNNNNNNSVQVKFTRGLVVFDIIEPNSSLIIDDLAECIEQWSQEML